ncbi:MAG: putative sulfate exporter family transporter [Actinomycetota bacterium]
MTATAPTPSPDTTPDGQATLGIAPGLLLAIGGAVVATLAAGALPVVSVAIVAVALGAAAANLGLVTDRLRPGLTFAAKRLLRVAVVLMGLRLSFGDIADIGPTGLAVVAATVAATFFGTQLLGRAMGLSADLSLLVATGYAICGVSAIAAVRNSTDAEDEEVAAAMGLVTLFGTAAMITLPVLGGVLDLTDDQFGLWAGASVHDVAQVVATAAAVGTGVVTTAVAVKLTRVALLAPLVLGVNVVRARRRATAAPGGVGPGTPILPLFVVGFLAMVAVRTVGVLPEGVLSTVGQLERWLLAVALVGLGAGIRISAFRRLGARPLLLGLVAWVLVAAVALVGALVLG